MLSRARTLPVGSLALLVTLGCSDVSTAAVDDIPEWGLVEDLRIGSVEGGEYPLRPVRGLVPLRDGSVLIDQLSVTEVPHFEPDGRLRRVMGREGDGPGEFRMVTNVGFVGDTIWVSDLRSRRISLFGGDGTHIRDYPIDFALLPDRPHIYPWPPHLLASESAVMFSGLMAGPGVEAPDATLPVFRTDRAGAVLDTLASWPLNRSYVWVDRARGRVPLRMPYSPIMTFDVSPGGSHVAIFTPSDGATAPEIGGLLTVWDAHLREIASVDVSAPAVEIPQSDLRLRAQEMVSGFQEGDAERNRIARELVQASGPSVRYPLIDNVLVSDAGDVWLRRAFPSDGERTWWIFSPAGERVASIRAPSGVTLMALEGDSVWGVLTDDLGVPFIIRYRIVPGS